MASNILLGPGSVLKWHSSMLCAVAFPVCRHVTAPGLQRPVGHVPSRGAIANPCNQALVRRAPAFRLFQRVAVCPLEAVAGGEIGLAIVVFPNPVAARLARPGASVETACPRSANA